MILAVRRPGQPIAWLLLVMALGLLLGTTQVTASLDQLLTGTAGALGEFTAWANGTGWVFVFAGFTGRHAHLPDGIAADRSLAGRFDRGRRPCSSCSRA